ncbi:MAG: zf-HC2 domain-containing protein [Acidobacteriota bacterium]
MNAGSHPSRSPEFLSRLHDGELSPAERAHFESHRAHCVECRGAAAEFEAALALYRSSRPNPASPDLAARILRKLQVGRNRRPSFGPTFGIDLRWAGAFAAAVIATIVGSAIVAKNEAGERRLAREAPIRVSVVQEEKKQTSEREPSRPNPAPPAPIAQNGATGATGTLGKESRRMRALPPETRQEKGSSRVAEAPRESAKKDELSAADSSREKSKTVEADAPASPPSRLAMKNAAPSPPQAQAAAQATSLDAAAPGSSRASERGGGEGTVAGFAEVPGRPVRLLVLQADGAGSPPDLLRSRDGDIPTTLRGRSFILVVDAAGRVRNAVPAGEQPREDEAANNARKDEALPLLSLRFAPGDHQRRLLLRVE